MTVRTGVYQTCLKFFQGRLAHVDWQLKCTVGPVGSGKPSVLASALKMAASGPLLGSCRRYPQTIYGISIRHLFLDWAMETSVPR